MTTQLLIEEIDLDLMESEILEEKPGSKKYVIKGPFIECNRKNKNSRIYPEGIIIPEVEKYQKLIESHRAVGELEHPNSMEINPKNISHKTTKLEFVDKNIVIGEATICSTPMGMIIKSLMDEGIKLAVSSRGAGTLKEGVVQSDYKYRCNDVVWDPSAPSAFVEGIMEAKSEWVLKNGILLEQELENLQTKLKKFKKKDINEGIIQIFKEALFNASDK